MQRAPRWLLHRSHAAPCASWRALEDMQSKGVVRDIGVSNFGEAHLEKLFQTAHAKPALNQVELQPWIARASLFAFCREHNILVEAFSPLSKAKMLDNAVLQQIAAEIEATPAQVLLAYSLAKDFISIPKSPHPERQRENLEALQLQLSQEQVATLEALDEDLVVAWDPIKLHEV